MSYYNVEYTSSEKNGIVFKKSDDPNDPGTFEINVGQTYILLDNRGLGTKIKVTRIEHFTRDVDKPQNIFYRVYKDFTAPGTSYTNMVLGKEEIFIPVDNLSGTPLMPRTFVVEPFIFPTDTKITEGGRRSKKSKKTKSKSRTRRGGRRSRRVRRIKRKSRR
jgi:hypothetical protein